MKLSTFKKAFGTSIQKQRVQKNLTQAELAEKLGIELSTLGKIECGMSFVSAKLLLKICSTLEVTPAELFNFSGKININTVFDSDFERVLEILFKCNNKELKKIYEILTSIIDFKK